MPRIIVTGASGFLGGHLVQSMLDAGWDVAVLTRKTVKGVPSTRSHHVDGSIASMAAGLTAFRPDCVIHLASLFVASHVADDVDRLIASNITLGAHLLEAMAQSDVRRLVCAGTAWQHRDDAAYAPVNLYAATKQAFEDLCRYYVDAHGFAAWHLRLGDTVGADDPRPKLFGLLDKARRDGATLDMSPGEQRLNLLDASDVAAGFMHAARTAIEGGSGERLFVLRHGESWRLRDIVTCYQRHAGGQPAVRFGAKPYRDREIMTPPTVPATLPGWQPRVSVESAIRAVATAHLAQDT
ncbi:MAG: NAD-dependent epimerase/dehydratase family protein [Phycisphaerales bacterium]